MALQTQLLSTKVEDQSTADEVASIARILAAARLFREEPAMSDGIVFLLDVDNTLLDNDRVQVDLRGRLERDFGPESAARYFAILEELRGELGYVDYLGALQRYRVEHSHEPKLLLMSSFLVDYPFANVVYPRALDVIQHLGLFGKTVILSDGDVVFQPRKVERAGILQAVSGRVLIFIHKEQELADVEKMYPARRYVLIDDKLRILTAVKKVWGSRVTTVFPRQGHYALDPKVTKEFPPADITVERIADLLERDKW
jgi:hypothetical protein